MHADISLDGKEVYFSRPGHPHVVIADTSTEDAMELRYGIKSPVTAVKVSYNKKYIAATFEDFGFAVWNRERPGMFMYPDRLEENFTLLTGFYRDEMFVAHIIGYISFINADEDRIWFNIILEEDIAVTALALTHDDMYICYAQSNGIMNIHNIDTRDIVYSLDVLGNMIGCIGLSIGFEYIFMKYENAVHIWMPSTGQCACVCTRNIQKSTRILTDYRVNHLVVVQADGKMCMGDTDRRHECSIEAKIANSGMPISF